MNPKDTRVTAPQQFQNPQSEVIGKNLLSHSFGLPNGLLNRSSFCKYLIMRKAYALTGFSAIFGGMRVPIGNELGQPPQTADPFSTPTSPP